MSVMFFVSITSAYAATVLPIELEVIAEVNLARTSNGLNSLAFDNILFEASRFHAEDMSTTGVVSHNLSDGTTPLQNFRNFGYATSEWGTNLVGYGFSSASSFIDTLMGSPAHRDILLNSGGWSSWNWEGIGVGWADNYFSIGLGTANVVPVPSAVWLFGTALMGLGVIKRKRV